MTWPNALDRVNADTLKLRIMGESVPTSEARRQPRVLIVDNEPLALEGFKTCLRRHAEVVVASRFDDAQAILERGEPFDAFVFDLNLDPGSGIELLAFAREHGYPKTPAMLVTGAEGHEYVNPAHALHAEVLTKPFPPEQLREFVRRASEEAETRSKRPSSFPEDLLSSVRAEGRESLDECIHDLRKLLAVRQTWQVRHAIGSIINEMMTKPDVFGARAVSMAAADLEKDVGR